MNAKFVSITLACASAGLIATSVYLFQQVQFERNRADVQAQEAQSAKLKLDQLSHVRVESASVAGGTSVGADQSKPEPLGSQSISNRQVVSAPTTVALGANPVAQNIRRTATKTMYASLLRDLRLSDDDANKLLDLLMSKQTKMAGIQEGALNPQEINRGLSDIERDVNNSIASLLGSDGYAKYEAYQRSITEHMSVKQLQSQLAMSGSAILNERQESALFRILTEEKDLIPAPNAEYGLPSAAAISDRLQWTEDCNRRVLARAEGILTPEQFAQFRARIQQQTDYMRSANASVAERAR